MYIFIIFLLMWIVLYSIFLIDRNYIVNIIVIFLFTVFELILLYIFNEKVFIIFIIISTFIKFVPVIYKIKW